METTSDDEDKKKKLSEHEEPDGDEGRGGPGDGDGDEKPLEDTKMAPPKEMTETGGDGEGGEEEDTEMSTHTCRGEAVELAAKVEDSKQVWIQIAKQGRFLGHGAGPFEMTSKTFSEIIQNFEGQKNRAIPIDFEHASEQSATSGSIPVMGAPAQGWIVKLELRADGNLWGLVEWGTLAKKYIRSGQYKFLSPAVVLKSKDRVTGKEIGARLSSAALTNNPFLDGMKPLAAKRTENGEELDTEIVQTICQALGLPAHADAKLACMTMQHIVEAGVMGVVHSQAIQLRDALRLPLTMSSAAIFAMAREACGEVLLTNVSPPATPVATSTNPPATARNEESNMGDGSKEKELETQVSQLTLKLNAAESEKKSAVGEAEAKLTLLTAENVDLKKKIGEFQEREVSALVDTALQVWGEKKGLTAESRPHLMRLAQNDREAFSALYPTVPASQVHLSQNITGNHKVPGQSLGTGGHSNNVIVMRDVINEDKIPDVGVIAERLMNESKVNGVVTMAREEAFSKAYEERVNLLNTAANKRAGNGG